MTETDQVRIARITAKQAIVVALITSLAGLLGAAIQKYGFGESAAPASTAEIQQDAIRFRGIEFHMSQDVSRYRVVLDVDGVPYSYPGNSVWKETGPKVPETTFPLRAGVAEHAVRIEVFAETANGQQINMISEQARRLTASTEPVNLRVVRRGGISRAGNAAATVQVEILPL